MTPLCVVLLVRRLLGRARSAVRADSITELRFRLWGATALLTLALRTLQSATIDTDHIISCLSPLNLFS